jgi:hypothetical protein
LNGDPTFKPKAYDYIFTEMLELEDAIRLSINNTTREKGLSWSLFQYYTFSKEEMKNTEDNSNNIGHDII